jgi:hypothetical protein
MSDSSQPKNSYDTLTVNGKPIDEYIKDLTIDLGSVSASGSTSDTTITSPYMYSTSYDYNIAPITLTGSTIDTITINGIDSNNYTFNLPQEWQDGFPEWHRVQNMCNEYPGLKVAFDNFKVFYEMVKNDYDNPTPKK